MNIHLKNKINLINNLKKNIKIDPKFNKNQINNKIQVNNKKLPLKYKLNTVFDHIYIINLKRTPKRKENMIKRLKLIDPNIKYEIFEAFDGSSPSNKDRITQIKKKSKLTNGEIGLSLSFINIMTDAQLKKYNKILILEDDCFFHKNFINKFNEAYHNLQNTNSNWKFIKFGNNLTNNYKIQYKNYWSKMNTNILNCGTWAMGFQKDCFQYYKNILSKFNKPCDNIPILNLAKKFPSYVMKNDIIISDVSQSTIRQKRNQKIWSLSRGWNLRNFDIIYS
jgi:GR25 family glycosyltransferase involved in LPS biosynthesis